MIDQRERGRNEGGGFLDVLRGLALVAVVCGAAASLRLMLRAGHPPLFLLVLFTGWVLSPFVALVVAGIASTRWSVLGRASLYGVMLIVTLGSLVFYGGMVSMPAGSRPAAVFLVIPLVSWLFVAIAFFSRRLSRPATRE